MGNFNLALTLGLMLATVTTRTAAAEPSPEPTFDPTIDIASAAAASDGSLVMVVFSAQWCGPCQEFKSQTLDSPQFRKQGGPLHVVDLDVDSNSKTAGDFSVQAIPTLVLMTTDGKIVERETGYMDTADLLSWIQEGRLRAKAGEWEGTAPGTKLRKWLQKLATQELSTNDLGRLVVMLGDPDPADRAAAGKLLLAQPTHAVPLLIQALSNPYLGERVGASELLRRLTADAIPIDPWQSPSRLAPTIAALQKWWAKTGNLPQANAPRKLDASEMASIRKALEALRGSDPMRRTEAMSTLVHLGPEVLPAIRSAIKNCERNADQKTVVLLEDVRWAILIPDAVERQVGGVRHALAQGSSPERQAAVTQLGHVGRAALPALTELINDSDPLVVESTVKALSNIGGKDAIHAMAALLRSKDSNLRMVAAQALGHTKDPAAIKPLLTVFDDPNELVCCTALSALEAILTPNSYGTVSGPLPPDVATALKGCLSDPRWRVRSAAAEVAGKLGANELTPDLDRLLNDRDDFVVKNALTALNHLNAAPDVKQLVALGKRLPSLRAETVQIMLQSQTGESIKTITKIFNGSTAAEQASILHELAQNGFNDNNPPQTNWKPLLTQAEKASDDRVRRAVAEVLGTLSPSLAAELITPLLADKDAQTRAMAADVVLSILAQKSGLSAGANSGATFTSSFSIPNGSNANTTRTNQPLATAEQIESWHKALLQHAQSPPQFKVAAALFVTGGGKSGLPMIRAAFDKLNTASVKRLENSMAFAVVLSRLPWPEGKPILDKLRGSPQLFALAVRDIGLVASPAATYLFEPSRFRQAVEPARDEALTEALSLVVGNQDNQNRTWSFWTKTARTKAVATALVGSTNAAWKAAAIFSLGLRSDAPQNLPTFEKALADSNAWVRAAAIDALIHCVRDRPERIRYLGPMVSDPNLHVAGLAAMALLEPEVRTAAGWQDYSQYFRYKSVEGGPSSSSEVNNRPLATLPGNPGFLASARRWLTATNAEQAEPFALLLAQYGDFEGLDRLIAHLPASGNAPSDMSGVVLAGIGLSHDPKYLPTLRRMVNAANDSWSLRSVLQALRGMPGHDARELRLEINQRLRNGSGYTP